MTRGNGNGRGVNGRRGNRFFGRALMIFDDKEVVQTNALFL
jgi:hypothetical protein